MKENFFQNYKANGYAISAPLLEKIEISHLRSQIDEELKDHQKGVIIGIEKIKNQNLLKKIIQTFASTEIKKFVEDIKKTINKNVFLLPKFQIHKNYHVNLKEFHGWHRDCGGELNYDYCKNILFDKKYFFSKIGIYLQKNSDFGGSIDIIKKSHKNFSKIKTIIRKIKNIPLKLVMIIHKKFNNLYFALPENLFMLLVSGKKLYPEESSAVFFDSRIIHRGSPISKDKMKDVNFMAGKYHAELPKEKNKYSLYCQLGTSDAVDSYFYDRSKRLDNANEIKNWLQQVEVIKKIDKNFANEIEVILKPIKKKYI